MNILITGASGLLGRSVFKRLSDNPAFTVTGTAFSRAQVPLIPLDLTDAHQLRAILQEYKPRVVIHCAAERWPDRCAAQPDAAWQLNVKSSEQLAQLCTEAGAQLVYISTDYVFDGTAAPYKFDDTPNPVNFYGRSKLAGEQAVLANGDHWVLRLPWLFGPADYLKESGITALLETVAAGRPEKLDDWATRYPTDVRVVAEVLAQCLERIAQGAKFSGVYHWSGDTACTRYSLALLVARVAELSADHLAADTLPNFAEPRPQNCQLDKSRLTELGIAPRESPQQQLEQQLERQLASCLAPFIAAVENR